MSQQQASNSLVVEQWQDTISALRAVTQEDVLARAANLDAGNVLRLQRIDRLVSNGMILVAVIAIAAGFAAGVLISSIKTTVQNL